MTPQEKQKQTTQLFRQPKVSSSPNLEIRRSRSSSSPTEIEFAACVTHHRIDLPLTPEHHRSHELITSRSFVGKALLLGTLLKHFSGGNRYFQHGTDSISDVITRNRNQAVVMMSLSEYESLQETAYLLRSPANAKRLFKSIESLESGKVIRKKLKL